MSMRPYPALLAAILLMQLVLAGCSSDMPTHLYKLSAVTDAAAPTSPKGVAIGVGPITLPKYLDRPQIVTGVTSNQMSQGNFDQWGGELNDNMSRVLAANLSNLLGTDRVSLYPWKDQAPIEYQVTLDVTQFEQEANGRTVLSAFWSIVNPKNGHVLTMRRTTYHDAGAPTPTPANASAGTATTGVSGTADPYDAVAAAMSRDLAALSRDIAAAIAALKVS
jgi:uncharacterized lipoprotein YmbA